MDGARHKQKHIRKYFRKNISGILVYVLQSNTTEKETFKTLYALASTHAYTGMHTQGEVSHVLFSKLKQI